MSMDGDAEMEREARSEKAAINKQAQSHLFRHKIAAAHSNNLGLCRKVKIETPKTCIKLGFSVRKWVMTNSKTNGSRTI